MTNDVDGTVTQSDEAHDGDAQQRHVHSREKGVYPVTQVNVVNGGVGRDGDDEVGRHDETQGGNGTFPDFGGSPEGALVRQDCLNE